MALRQPEDGLPIDRPPGPTCSPVYAARVEGLVARGARIVVLPEKVFAVTDTTMPVLVAALQQTEAQVVVGAVRHRADRASNVALVLEPGGTVATYEKQHLIPGLEDWLTPGEDEVLVDGRFGVAICKDLDHPGLVRRYRAQGASVLLVPALDFTSDGWLHGRMALVRGVENGLVVVRAAAFGRLTVTDPGGRMVGEATAGDAELLLTTPTSGWGTVYSRTGDWFRCRRWPCWSWPWVGWCRLPAVPVGERVRVGPRTGLEVGAQGVRHRGEGDLHDRVVGDAE